MKKLISKKSNDRGVVIIFTLILLSMMMVTGFAFVAQTGLDHKISKAYSRNGMINDFSKGILANITHNFKAIIEKKDPGTPVPGDDYTAETLIDIKNPEAHSMFSRLWINRTNSNNLYDDIRASFLSDNITSLNGDGSSDRTRAKQPSASLEFYLGEGTGNEIISSPTFFQGYVNSSGSASNARTIVYDGIDVDGDDFYDYRYSYMMLSQVGKIDPNYALSTDFSEQNSFDRYNDRINDNGTPSVLADDTIDTSIAPHYSELSLAGTLDTSSNSSLLSDIKDLKDPAVGWSSFSHISQALNLPDGSDNLTNSNSHPNYYSFYPYSVEEVTPRLDLTGRYKLSDINDSSIAQVVGPSGDVNAPDLLVFDTDDDSTADKSVIDVLNEAGIVDNSTSPSTDRDGNSVMDGLQAGLGMSSANQLAANILDYCDTDIIARNDFNFDIANTDDQTYQGFEKAPRLSEIVIKFGVTENLSPADPSERYTTNINPPVTNGESYVEIYYPFGNENVITAATATLKFRIEIDSEDNYEERTITFSRIENSIDDNGYLILHDPQGDLSWFNSRRRLKYQYLKAELNVTIGSKTGICDTARVWGSDHTFSRPENEDFYAFSCIATDILNNSTPTSWWTSFYKSNAGVVDYNQSTFDRLTPEAANTGVNGGTADASTSSGQADKETTTHKSKAPNFRNISTAYFRNDTPQSLVELGAIRTGNTWQTLDLLAKPVLDNGIYKGHYALLNLFRLGDNIGQEKVDVNGVPYLAEISGRRLNANSRFPFVLKSAFAGQARTQNAPEYIPTSDSQTIDSAKLDTLTSLFPGVDTKDNDIDDFAVKNDEYLVDGVSTPDITDPDGEAAAIDAVYASTLLLEVDDCRSIFGSVAKKPDNTIILNSDGSTVPDRNPVHYRKPFREARGNSSTSLSDHEAERLFWDSKDLMGGMAYFSIVYSIQPGRGDESKNYPLYFNKANSEAGFTPSSDFSVYRAEISYGLNPDTPNNRRVKQLNVMSIRKTK